MYRDFPPVRENFPPGSSGLKVLAGDALERLLSVRQVAAQLQLSTATVYALVARGELPHVRLSGAVRVSPADLRAFIAEKGRGR